MHELCNGNVIQCFLEKNRKEKKEEKERKEGRDCGRQTTLFTFPFMEIWGPFYLGDSFASRELLWLDEVQKKDPLTPWLKKSGPGTLGFLVFPHSFKKFIFNDRSNT